ncbi:MAG: hypothetical protein H7Y33_10065 [Cytophagales bacterium]|nr:hypothetical protein [Rhizobacter sp.]
MAAQATAPPQDGRYDGLLCVSVATTSANCGPVEVELNNGTQAQVRVSDITYQLWLYPSRLNAVLMHGNMQIHQFESGYVWQGLTLQFADTPKNARYELKLVDRRP